MVQAYGADTGNDRVEPEPERAGSGSRLRDLRGRWTSDPGIWRRGIVLALCSVVLTLVMAFHARIPNTIGNLGSLSETFLPWIGVFVPLLLVLGLVRRSATALIALLLPVVVWFNVFGGLLTDKSGSGGDLTVATHNVNADNTDPKGTARTVADSGADVIALEELPSGKVAAYKAALADRYPYHSVQGTVGLWSKFPMSGTKPVDIKMGWTRAMRSTVTTPEGKVAVYVAHLPSVRVKLHAGFTANQRDDSADALGEAISDERLGKVILLGDLNGTMNDRALNGVTAQMRSTQGAAGDGFGFSWPASFPMARIDQILVKGVEPMSSWTLSATKSDHLPLVARVEL
ncbi:endonuclease/exonuclease/phosphatase family protein [Streptomyces sp. NPDC057697]|uniref:endonuclease/exonuclease/phosphatase family protein n=1 Tax=Streptomyces sp. NPDC057697 TaxID=3346219 RepID=UPI003690E51E